MSAPPAGAPLAGAPVFLWQLTPADVFVMLGRRGKFERWKLLEIPPSRSARVVIEEVDPPEGEEPLRSDIFAWGNVYRELDG
ncbi:hypothetical protein LCGC14_0877490 [marine sediment metagenome]|uniref:Uncharacterized protein n=1 Tax=marine sediment metagenome TaxID=412755 RepID=A0A0F9S9U2_9ZZZZ